MWVFRASFHFLNASFELMICFEMSFFGWNLLKEPSAGGVTQLMLGIWIECRDLSNLWKPSGTWPASRVRQYKINWHFFSMSNKTRTLRTETLMEENKPTVQKKKILKNEIRLSPYSSSGFCTLRIPLIWKKIDNFSFE